MKVITEEDIIEDVHTKISFICDNEYTNTYHVEFEIEIYNEDYPDGIQIGGGTGLYLAGYDYQTHYQSTEIPDSVSEDSYELYTGFNPDCLREPDMVMYLIQILTMEIKPEFRGKGYGIEAMEQIVTFFTTIPSTVIIIRPAPLGKPLKENGEIRLQKYWEKCGFKQCKNTPYFYKECSFID